MHLMSVDFPAPLSPTSAMTSPARTSKSTSSSAWTDPKFLDTPFVSRVGADADCSVGAGGASGAIVIAACSLSYVEGGARRAPPSGTSRLLAELRVLAATHVALLQIPVEQDLVVRLRDRDGRDDVRGQSLALVRHRPGPGGPLALQVGDGCRDGLRRELPRVLPDGHRLPPGDDVLHARSEEHT